MKEYQVRPKKLFDKYIDLAERDAKVFFKKSKFKKTNCLACGYKSKFLFTKINFSYCECLKCNTIYVNPRPSQNDFLKYYTDSKSSKFWASDFYKKTLKSRKLKIWKPKSKLVTMYLNKEKNIKNIIDIGAGYGLFLDEIKKINKVNTYAIEPTKHLGDICKQKKHNVISKFIERLKPLDIPKGKNFYTCFELFEHLHNPKIFIKRLNQLMKKNEILFLTTLSGTGLDISVLKERSKSLQPPYHINFFNPDSIKLFMEKNKFKIVSITTPGKLDIDILANNEFFIKDKFWKKFVKYANNKEKKNMQNFLQKSLLSSHMIVVCKKVQ